MLIKAQAVDAVSLLVGRAGVRKKERWGQRMRSWKRKERERGPKATVRDGGPRVCTGPGLGTQGPSGLFPEAGEGQARWASHAPSGVTGWDPAHVSMRQSTL